MLPSEELNIKWWLKEKRHKRGYYGDELDQNGYAKSIFDKNHDGRCYLCGRVCDTARHEIYGGADRDTSKALGLYVCLCPSCHDQVHANHEGLMDSLHKAGERVFEYYHSSDEFVAFFGRKYL